MNPLLHRLEQGFAIFVLFFFTNALAMDSLYISPDPAADASAAYNPIYPVLSLLQLLIYGLTTMLLCLRWRTTLQIACRAQWIWLLMGLVLLSCFWSDFAELSLRRSINAIQTGLFGLYLASRFPQREQLRLLAWALGLVAAFSLLFTLAFPGAAIEIGVNAGAWRGPLTQKNLLGRLMVLTAIVCFLVAIDRRRRRALPLMGAVLATGLLVLSGSKTGLLVFITLLLLFPLYRALRWQQTLLIPLIIAVILVAGSVGAIVLGNWESLLLALGRDPTLSGRTDLWIVALEKIGERPWLGYGFQGFWLPGGGAMAVWQAVQYKPPHAHNGYINMALDLGLIGLTLFGLCIANLSRRGMTWVKFDRSAIGLWSMIYATFFFLYNHSENTIVEHNSIFWTMFVAATLSLKRLQVVQTEPIYPSIATARSQP